MKLCQCTVHCLSQAKIKEEGCDRPMTANVKYLSHTMNMNQEINFVGAFLTEQRVTSEFGCSEK